MNFILFICIFLFIGSSYENHNYTSSLFGGCSFDDLEKRLIFICFENNERVDFFNESIYFICGNDGRIIQKVDVLTLGFTNCVENKIIPDIGSFRNTMALHVMNMGLQDLSLNYLQKLQNLQFLNASNNRLLGNVNFSGLNNLKTLDLSSNAIGNITAEKFQSMISLEKLYLNYANIMSIKSDAFKNLRNLVEINLANNFLSYIDPKTFKYLKKLVSIDLTNNNLVRIDLRMFLTSFNTLSSVNLNENSIENLGYTNKFMFPRLHTLSVCNNKLKCNYLREFLNEGGWSSSDIRISTDSMYNYIMYYNNTIDLDEINELGRPVCTN